MQKPLMSILTPFKGTEAFIAECLQSIVNQNYQNWELLIVDDHSMDRSFEIVDAFAQKDSRIKLLKNKGEGIIDALKTAYGQSSGELITRMDSDDIMTPNKLSVLVDNLYKYGKGHVAIGLVEYFSAHGVGPGYKSYENWLNDLTRTGNNYSEIYKECVIPSPCWMVFREDFEACGAFEPNIYPEDYDLTFRFYKHGLKCIPCNQTLHKWRDYSTRTSRTHVHYAQNHFTTLKVHHFLDIDYDQSKRLAIWGAGTKGKLMASLFLERDIPFEWICDNPNKIGKAIYGKTLLNFDALVNIKNPQSLITVANKTAQKEIRAYLSKLNLKPFEDFIFFC
ncbi:glycosyltransferase [Hyunsoonleella sp. SJ7]|uniref:Glycosyltransferase n=2 Tax=Hyunsoonleella aquatilis TaxID=2762758 RepID=A0A923KMF7_9FLAO|nr:glycosyltransferase family 2 protein [Hyunsoonleella aquatilis]MBC3759728.1 glycosyltransferase [Hyunsoonleella aquatilis]